MGNENYTIHSHVDITEYFSETTDTFKSQRQNWRTLFGMIRSIYWKFAIKKYSVELTKTTHKT